MLSGTNDAITTTETLPPPSTPIPPTTSTSITIQPPPPPLAPNISIEPITTSTLSAYRCLITSLLPIRYQEKYYTESVADPSPTSLALCAIYHDPHLPLASKASSVGPGENVVAGIQCRLEPLPPLSASTSTLNPRPLRHPPLSPPLAAQAPRQNLYISTLCTLSPHRSLGIATALLNHIIYTLLTHPAYAKYTIVTLYAHVWEANEEALEWYQRRGFTLEKGVVEGYYRKLRPMGARIVRREIKVGDYVRAKGRTLGSLRDLEGD